ncbi:hypothetical protein ACIO1C_29585 [Streptomyces sp. NPDC087420]|uniref:hypothetical protein n=1 Tax=Streptomyces sp. NPDC087420 TaxID=3365785 RepID=UPI00383378B3
MKIDRLRIDGEPVRRFFLIAEVTFADREAQPRDERDHNYYEDRELRSLATEWMGSEMQYHDDSPMVRFTDVSDAWHEELLRRAEVSDGG